MPVGWQRESEEIGIVGVDESTVPYMKMFNSQVLGMREADVVALTQGTFELGILFNDWGRCRSISIG